MLGIGRRWAFNGTVLITCIFGLCLGAPDTYNVILVLTAFNGFEIGGNIPIDTTICLEFLPQVRIALSSLQWKSSSAHSHCGGMLSNLHLTESTFSPCSSFYISTHWRSGVLRHSIWVHSQLFLRTWFEVMQPRPRSPCRSRSAMLHEDRQLRLEVPDVHTRCYYFIRFYHEICGIHISWIS